MLLNTYELKKGGSIILEANLPFKTITMKNTQMLSIYVQCICHDNITY